MANLDRGSKTISLTQRSGWWVPEADEVCLDIVLREVHDLNIILPYCRQFRRAVQAGGNVGIWPKALADRFDMVHTFEPDEANFAALQRNVSNRMNIIYTNAGLGEIHYTGSMDHIDPKNIGAHQIKEGNDFEILPLDQYVYEDVDLLQLDVEGFEHMALLGARHTIELCSPVICLELKGLGKRYGVDDSETLELLAALGYKEKARIHRDVIFARW